MSLSLSHIDRQEVTIRRASCTSPFGMTLMISRSTLIKKLIIEDIAPNSPASMADLRKHDVILSLNGEVLHVDDIVEDSLKSLFGTSTEITLVRERLSPTVSTEVSISSSAPLDMLASAAAVSASANINETSAPSSSVSSQPIPVIAESPRPQSVLLANTKKRKSKIVEVISLLSDDEDEGKTIKKDIGADKASSMDDECVIVVPPAKKSRVSESYIQEKSGNEINDDDDDDVQFVGGSFESINSMPHQREACSQHPFKIGSSAINAKNCDFCYCYICDVKASECLEWLSGHCNASFKNEDSQREKTVFSSPFLRGCSRHNISFFWATCKDDLSLLSRCVYSRNMALATVNKLIKQAKLFISTEITVESLCQSALLLVLLLRSNADCGPDLMKIAIQALLDIFCHDLCSEQLRNTIVTETDHFKYNSMLHLSRDSTLHLIRLMHRTDPTLAWLSNGTPIPSALVEELNRDNAGPLLTKLLNLNRAADAKRVQEQLSLLGDPVSMLLRGIMNCEDGATLKAVARQMASFNPIALDQLRTSLTQTLRLPKDIVRAMCVISINTQMLRISDQRILPSLYMMLIRCYSSMSTPIEWTTEWASNIMRQVESREYTLGSNWTDVMMMQLGVGIMAAASLIFSDPTILMGYLRETSLVDSYADCETAVILILDFLVTREVPSRNAQYLYCNLILRLSTDPEFIPTEVTFKYFEAYVLGANVLAQYRISDIIAIFDKFASLFSNTSSLQSKSLTWLWTYLIGSVADDNFNLLGVPISNYIIRHFGSDPGGWPDELSIPTRINIQALVELSLISSSIDGEIESVCKRILKWHAEVTCNSNTSKDIAMWTSWLCAIHRLPVCVEIILGRDLNSLSLQAAIRFLSELAHWNALKKYIDLDSQRDSISTLIVRNCAISPEFKKLLVDFSAVGNNSFLDDLAAIDLKCAFQIGCVMESKFFFKRISRRDTDSLARVQVMFEQWVSAAYLDRSGASTVTNNIVQSALVLDLAHIAAKLLHTRKTNKLKQFSQEFVIELLSDLVSFNHFDDLFAHIGAKVSSLFLSITVIMDRVASKLLQVAGPPPATDHSCLEFMCYFSRDVLAFEAYFRCISKLPDGGHKKRRDMLNWVSKAAKSSTISSDIVVPVLFLFPEPSLTYELESFLRVQTESNDTAILASSLTWVRSFPNHALQFFSTLLNVLLPTLQTEKGSTVTKSYNHHVASLIIPANLWWLELVTKDHGLGVNYQGQLQTTILLLLLLNSPSQNSVGFISAWDHIWRETCHDKAEFAVSTDQQLILDILLHSGEERWLKILYDVIRVSSYNISRSITLLKAFTSTLNRRVVQLLNQCTQPSRLSFLDGLLDFAIEWAHSIQAMQSLDTSVQITTESIDAFFASLVGILELVYPHKKQEVRAILSITKDFSLETIHTVNNLLDESEKNVKIDLLCIFSRLYNSFTKIGVGSPHMKVTKFLRISEFIVTYPQSYVALHISEENLLSILINDVVVSNAEGVLTSVRNVLLLPADRNDTLEQIVTTLCEAGSRFLHPLVMTSIERLLRITLSSEELLDTLSKLANVNLLLPLIDFAGRQIGRSDIKFLFDLCTSDQCSDLSRMWTVTGNAPEGFIETVFSILKHKISSRKVSPKDIFSCLSRRPAASIMLHPSVVLSIDSFFDDVVSSLLTIDKNATFECICHAETKTLQSWLSLTDSKVLQLITTKLDIDSALNLGSVLEMAWSVALNLKYEESSRAIYNVGARVIDDVCQSRSVSQAKKDSFVALLIAIKNVFAFSVSSRDLWTRLFSYAVKMLQQKKALLSQIKKIDSIAKPPRVVKTKYKS